RSAPAAPAERGAATSLFEASVIDEAIGALIGQGYTPEQAERHLIAEGADAGISRHGIGLRILAGLDARYPLIGCSVSKVGNPASPG
ncbi:MAG: hypothetical protein QOD10_2127, partial [Mycobacterium sp.]|nr:hypothetical protein [Mycobacterium sp.]